MQWIFTKQLDHSSHWQLEGARKTIELRFNKEARSFRLNAGEKRLYFLERTGFFQNKLQITSEYHVKLGECYFIKNRYAGILQLHNEKYEFRVSEKQISILRKDKTVIGQVIVENLDGLDIFEFGALLFAFVGVQHHHYNASAKIVHSS